MNRHAAVHGTTWVAALVVGFLAIGGAVAAQDLGAERLATVSVSSDGIHFSPEVEHGGAVLTVSGGGDARRYSFAVGETPFISAFDDHGGLLPDGIYKWELELLLTAEARRELIAATENRDDARSVREPQSGTFAISGGFIADPGLEEAVSGRSRSDGADLLASDPVDLRASEPIERIGNDSDATADMCEARSSLRSASCEARVQEAVASQEGQAIDIPADGVETPKRTGFGDLDAEVVAGGPAAAEFVLTSSFDEATPPRRFVDPTGENGRPRSEKEQRSLSSESAETTQPRRSVDSEDENGRTHSEREQR